MGGGLELTVLVDLRAGRPGEDETVVVFAWERADEVVNIALSAILEEAVGLKSQ